MHACAPQTDAHVPIQLDTSHDGPCFDDWADDSGGGKWVKQWGSAPAAGTLKVATCNKLLGWYPAFAGRYTSAWGKEYGACKERELHKPGDYYSQRMWPICRPAAMLAHDSAMGRGGAGQEATPPFVMRTLYGQARAKVVAALRPTAPSALRPTPSALRPTAPRWSPPSATRSTGWRPPSGCTCTTRRSTARARRGCMRTWPSRRAPSS